MLETEVIEVVVTSNNQIQGVLIGDPYGFLRRFRLNSNSTDSQGREIF